MPKLPLALYIMNAMPVLLVYEVNFPLHLQEISTQNLAKAAGPGNGRRR